MFTMDKDKKNNVVYSDYYSLAKKEKKNGTRLNTEEDSTRSRHRHEACEYF